MMDLRIHLLRPLLGLFDDLFWNPHQTGNICSKGTLSYPINQLIGEIYLIFSLLVPHLHHLHTLTAAVLLADLSVVCAEEGLAPHLLHQTVKDSLSNRHPVEG
jgi:hypothetical protein